MNPCVGTEKIVVSYPKWTVTFLGTCPSLGLLEHEWTLVGILGTEIKGEHINILERRYLFDTRMKVRI